MRKKEKKEEQQKVSLSFASIYCTPNFTCPKCSFCLSYHVGYDNHNDPVWWCRDCDVYFKPMLHLLKKCDVELNWLGEHYVKECEKRNAEHKKKFGW